MSVDSSGENALAEAAARDIGSDGEGCWIGFNDISTEGTWVLVTGEPTNYTNWDTAAGEPGNSGGNEDAAYVCGAGCSGHVIGEWNDSNAAMSWHYILEIDHL